MRSQLVTIITLILLPVIIFLSTIGWILYFLGLGGKPAPARKKPKSETTTIATAIDKQCSQKC